MAIIQISQIRHRRGNVDDFKAMKDLEEGEIGLILEGDETNPGGTVFIGTPDLPAAKLRSEENVFPYGNTQILTEWSKNIEELLRYTYLYRSEVKYSVSAASSASAASTLLYINASKPQAKPILRLFNQDKNIIRDVEIRRNLQEKLDESVSIKDYGARGEGTLDILEPLDPEYVKTETYAIRRAAVDVTNVTNDDSTGFSPRALRFPSGVYPVNDALILPPQSTWIGEGKGKTIISLRDNNEKTYSLNDCLLFTVNGNLQPEDVYTNSAIANYSYENIANPGDDAIVRLPENIVISGITFRIDRPDSTPSTPHDVLRLIGTRRATFYDCEFVGNWDRPEFSSTSAKSTISSVRVSSRDYYAYYPGNVSASPDFGDSIALVLDSAGGLEKTHDVDFIRCDVRNTTYAGLFTDSIRDIDFVECSFNQHYRGLSINEALIHSPAKNNTGLTALEIENSSAPVSFIGPRNIKIAYSNFNNIKAEGISVRSIGVEPARTSYETEFFKSGRILSIGNRFENVGNNETFGGLTEYPALFSANPAFPVINFEPGTQFNASMGDMFSRDYILEAVGGTYGTVVHPVNSMPRICFDTRDSNVIITPTDFYFEPKRSITLINGITDSTGIRFAPEANTVFIEYSIAISAQSISKKRIGNLQIISNETGNAELTDEYTEVGGPVDIDFNVFVDTDDATVLEYTHNDIAEAEFYYTIKHNDSDPKS